MVDILWNERNVATRMVKRGCIVKRAPSIKKKKQEGISFEKSLLSVATGEHCLVCSIYYTYIYIYHEIDSESRPWKNAKQETSVLRVDASRCLAPANLAFFLLPFFLQPLQFLPRWARNSFYAIRWYVTRKFCVWRGSSVVSVVVEHRHPSSSSSSFYPLQAGDPLVNQTALASVATKNILESRLKKK